MKLSLKFACAGLVATPLLMTGTPALANVYVPVALPLVDLNANIITWTSGSDYTSLFAAGNVVTSTGVPFTLVSRPGDGNNALANISSVDIPVGVYGVTQVYTLINSAFGANGTHIGQLTFSFGSGASYAVDLVEGVNVRDHYYGNYTNTLTDASVLAPAFGPADPWRAHLDMQTFNVPGAYANDTLTKVTFVSDHAGGGGEPMMAALTVAAVPEPESVALVLAGLATLAAMRKRLSR